MKPKQPLSTAGKEIICADGSLDHDVLLCVYSYGGVSTTGERPRAAKHVCPVLEALNSIEEESVAKASSRTDETFLSV